MDIHVKGAKEHNLKNIDARFGEGLTVVTGVSGSGKSSLVFDTVYHEAHRRFLDVYLYGRGGQRLAPARVDNITGLMPAIAVGQNLLNRNPASILATASGLHPFLRLLFTNYGIRNCVRCGNPLSVLTEDEIIDRISTEAKNNNFGLFAPLLSNVAGSHKTLLAILADTFGTERILVDNKIWNGKKINPDNPHSIEIRIGHVEYKIPLKTIRTWVKEIFSLGAGSVKISASDRTEILTTLLRCTVCGNGFKEVKPTHFNRPCPYCEARGCEQCGNTGMHPQAASVTWQKMRLPELLRHSVEETGEIFRHVSLPSTADRLCSEIVKRLDALEKVGLGYLSLDRPAPTLSRGEAQRVRLAILLSSNLEDMIHILDEPTVGQHPRDIERLLPAFRELSGPVIFVEHERMAAASADRAMDMGPGAGKSGGNIIFDGSPHDLWKANTPTGEYFSLRKQVIMPDARPAPDKFMTIKKARAHNLDNIDVRIPLGRLTVITGVSGSGKSTLVEHVIVPTLVEKKPVFCDSIDVTNIRPVMVDQSPIGRNPRSNPATYTKLSDMFRYLFEKATDLSKSHFSFNRPEGACENCDGIGSIEVKMRHLPSIWIPCDRCDGQRFSDGVLTSTIRIDNRDISIAELYSMPIREVRELIPKIMDLPASEKRKISAILDAFNDIGLGYLELGQPSTTLSGGEAQRVKLTKYLGRTSLKNQMIILDEPSTGLHPQDLKGLVMVIDRLVRSNATVIVIEHNTDFMRAADWIIDLGPGAGPRGGKLIYEGLPSGILEIESSATGNALKHESNLIPSKKMQKTKKTAGIIKIKNAWANNLKGVDIDIPKNSLTVFTGVSGSGKSSIVRDVIETEARRRYLESLSMFERQGINEKSRAPVESISGLGVTLTLSQRAGAHLWSRIQQFTRRNSVGSITEISFHLAAIISSIGQRKCMKCNAMMIRREEWTCPECGSTAPVAKAAYFSSDHYSSSCPVCNGLGSTQAPAPEKLISNPDKPLCRGAIDILSGYMCRDQPIIPAIAKHYGFDSYTTPWSAMSEQAKHAFLYGDGNEYEYTYISKSTGKLKGSERTRKIKWDGFFGETFRITDWDVQGRFTRQETCSECNGTGFRPVYLAVTLKGKNIYELSEMSLNELEGLINLLPVEHSGLSYIESSISVLKKRLRFLRQVGTGYLNLNRPAGTLSAGEAQRIQLAGLLGGDLHSLTILIDEPSRGMHPSELEALKDALFELRDGKNTVIIVEHDPLLIRSGDYIVDMGPGAGVEGGRVVAKGALSQIIRSGGITGKWLKKDSLRLSSYDNIFRRRKPEEWIIIKGARENNLKGETVKIPKGVLTGICGVSGSGKSTLLIDTIGRALAKTGSSLVSKTSFDPGKYDSIENQPAKTIIIDQVKRDVRNPAIFLGLNMAMLKIYADTDDAHSLGIGEKELMTPCSVCNGSGGITIDMGFLPDEFVECEMCRGTGFPPEAWEVHYRGVPLPEVNKMTLDEVYAHFIDEMTISRQLKIVREVGLGYLVWQQPGYTLSGGEAQRIKIVKELQKKANEPALYILDEPTLGLHMEDISRLLDVLNRLVDAGHTVAIVEHHPHVLFACDWLIELGPGGGPDGGKIIAVGTPEDVIRKNTPTSPYLKELL